MNERIHSDFPPFPEFIRQGLGGLITTDESMKALSISTRVPYSSLSRMKNEGCKLTCIHAKTLVAKIAKDESHLEAILEHYYPEEAKIWRSAYSLDNYRIKPKPVIELIEKNPIYFYIESFAGLLKGLPMAAIDRLWGELGFEKAQDYLDIGHLDMAEDRVHRVKKHGLYGRLETLKIVIGYLVEDFRIDNIHNKVGTLTNIVGCLNINGLIKVRDICIKAAGEVGKVISDPTYQGDLPMHASFISGQMKGAAVFKEESEKLSERDTRL